MSERVNASAGWSTSGIGRWRAGLALLMPRRTWRVPVLLALALGVFLLQAASAGAVFRPGPPPGPPPQVRANTELVMSGTGNGQAVSGFIATASNTFDPVKDGYPTSNPSTERDPSPLEHPQRRLRRHHPWPADRRQPRTPPLLHRHLNRNVRRNRVLPGHLGRRQRPQRGLRGAAAQRVLPQHRRTGHADRSQPEGRRRAGGDLVLHRPLCAEHF